ncbi:MAG TPA: hypothetical protein DCS82_02895 [Rhodospirillaceae bacterium]|nr:hypothetical protein [Rhodospirillaceae bacterium]HAA92725.1 hypothetical protein [Rhodospirillaceae bacterium]HAT34638.1 hypothetical protein [Rhodospirillaceae bacterium]|tara:strand:+ start:275 stop:1252 length:978 start_codon:yes stop_codon:yes gene_type:complete
MARNVLPWNVAVIVTCVLSVALIVLPCTGSAQSPGMKPLLLAEADRKKTLVIGRISRSARRHAKRVQILADYLGEQLQEFGIRNTQSLIAEDLPTMIRHFKNGEVDLISETAYGAVELANTVGARPLLLEWKHGNEFYKSIIFVRKDSAISTLADLKGKVIAYEDPGSTSAFFVPLIMLHQAGLSSARMKSIRSPLQSDKANYVFTEGELNQVSLVLNKNVDAAAFSNSNWEEFIAQNDEISGLFRILGTSPPILRSVMLARQNLNPDLRDKIVELLIDIDQTSEGRKVLKKYNKVEQYSLFEDATQKSWHWIAEFRRKMTNFKQ